MSAYSGQGTPGRKTAAVWPIALALALLWMVLGYVAAFSYVGLAFILTGLVFLAISAGAFLSRWTPRAWQAYASVFLLLLGLLTLAYCTD
jgi:amino acid permease